VPKGSPHLPRNTDAFPFEELQIFIPEAMLDNRSIQCSAERVIAISVIVLLIKS